MHSHNTQSQDRRLTLRHMMAYGCIDFYGGGAFLIIGSLYVVFLTVVIGLSPLHAGSIILAGKVCAAFANALAGYVSDRTRSRFGRRRPYFLLGLLPFFSILWMPVKLADYKFTFIYHLAAYLIYNSVFSFTKIPYNSILTEMTTDFQERSRAMGVWMIFSQVGTFVGAFLPLTIIASQGSQESGYRAFGLIFGLLFALPWLFGFLGTWEPPVAVPESRGFVTEMGLVFQSFRSTMKNRTFMIHMGMYLLGFLNMDIFNGIFVFFAMHSLGFSLEKARNLMTLIQGCQVLAVPLVTYALCKWSTAKAYRTCLTIWGVGIAILALTPRDSTFWMLVPWAALTGFGLSGAMMIPWNNQSFMADIDELITTERREGVYAGFMQFVRQIAIGAGLFVTNAALEAMGFARGYSVQSPVLGESLRYFMLLVPALVITLAIMVSFAFSLTEKRHQIILGEIKRRRHGGNPAEVPLDVRRVCEQLTGLPYEQLWQKDNARSSEVLRPVPEARGIR